MALAFPNKRAGERKRYGFDWAKFLRADRIDTSSWTVESGLTKVSDTSDSTTTTIMISGGTSGTTYTLVNTVATTGGEIFEEVGTITIE